MLDGLVHNAGITRRTPVGSFDINDVMLLLELT